jgi:hypothetical protein
VYAGKHLLMTYHKFDHQQSVYLAVVLRKDKISRPVVLYTPGNDQVLLSISPAVDVGLLGAQLHYAMTVAKRVEHLNATTNITTYKLGEKSQQYGITKVLPFYTISIGNSVLPDGKSVQFSINLTNVGISEEPTPQLLIYYKNKADVIHQSQTYNTLPVIIEGFNAIFNGSFPVPNTTDYYGYLWASTNVDQQAYSLFRIPVTFPVIANPFLSVYTQSKAESKEVKVAVSFSVYLNISSPCDAIDVPVVLEFYNKTSEIWVPLQKSNIVFKCSESQWFFYEFDQWLIDKDVRIRVGEELDRRIWPSQPGFAQVVVDAEDVNIVLFHPKVEDAYALKAKIRAEVWNSGSYPVSHVKVGVYYADPAVNYSRVYNITTDPSKLINEVVVRNIPCNKTALVRVPLTNVKAGTYNLLVVATYDAQGGDTLKIDNFQHLPDVEISADAEIMLSENKVYARTVVVSDRAAIGGTYEITFVASNDGAQPVNSSYIVAYSNNTLLANISVTDLAAHRCALYSLFLSGELIESLMAINATLELDVPPPLSGSHKMRRVLIDFGAAMNNSLATLPDCSIPLDIKPKITKISDVVVTAGDHVVLEITVYDLYCDQFLRTYISNHTHIPFVNSNFSTQGLNLSVTLSFQAQFANISSEEPLQIFHNHVHALDSRIVFLTSSFNVTVLRLNCSTNPCEDYNQCTTDICTPTTGCSHVPRQCVVNLFVPANKTVYCGDNLSPSVLGYANATDTCGDLNMTISYNDTTIYTNSSKCPTRVVIMRRWNVVNSCGFSQHSVQVISVQSGPHTLSITPPSLAPLTCIVGQTLNISAITNAAVATDLCVTQNKAPVLPTVVATLPLIECVLSLLGLLVQETWVATDACGIQVSTTVTLSFIIRL